MGSMIGTGNDVVSYLLQQHEQIKTLFEDVLRARGKARSNAFYTLRKLLAVHETAEEEIIHPVVRKNIPNGEFIVEARLTEERDAKRVLAQLEKFELDSDKFDIKVRALQRAVLAHAELEEHEEFLKLGAIIDPAGLERMKKAAEFAESVAPTRPHPGIESATANILAGPFAAMVDRVRDAVSK